MTCLVICQVPIHQTKAMHPQHNSNQTPFENKEKEASTNEQK